MDTEIERKFLIRLGFEEFITPEFHEIYPDTTELLGDIGENGVNLVQGYLPLDLGVKLAGEFGLFPKFEPNEVRLRNRGGIYYITVKGKGSTKRGELEKEIDRKSFAQWWPRTEGNRIEKARVEKRFRGYQTEFDVYTDRKPLLIIAEVSAKTLEEVNALPALGREVTGFEDYKNRTLAR